MSQQVDKEKPSGSDKLKASSMGKALKRVFRQEDLLKKIEPQPATESFLMSEARRKIFQHLCQNPCDHVRGVAKAVGTSAPASGWQLNALKKAYLLESITLRRKKVYWPMDMLDYQDIPVAEIFRREWAGQLLALTLGAQKGGITESEAVEELRESQQKVNNWLGLMTMVGILAKSGAGRGARYKISSDFIKKVKYYEARAEGYSVFLLVLVETDGLIPKSPRLTGTTLSVSIKLPSGRQRLRLECNPLASASRMLKYA